MSSGSTYRKEFGNHSVHNSWWDSEHQKRREHAILHVQNGVTQLPECEAVEYPNHNRNEELAVQIARISPVLLEDTLKQALSSEATSKRRTLSPALS